MSGQALAPGASRFTERTSGNKSGADLHHSSTGRLSHRNPKAKDVSLPPLPGRRVGGCGAWGGSCRREEVCAPAGKPGRGRRLAELNLLLLAAPHLGWATVLSKEAGTEARVKGRSPEPGVVRVQRPLPLLLRIFQPGSLQIALPAASGPCIRAARASATRPEHRQRRPQVLTLPYPTAHLTSTPATWASLAGQFIHPHSQSALPLGFSTCCFLARKVS